MPQSSYQDEALLHTTKNNVGDLPTIECANCHFEADHFFWYDGPTYAHRKLKFCPNCGMRLFGIVVLNREDE